jgi:uncharacterized protein (UPF0248 family)
MERNSAALQQTQEIANLFTRYGEDLETLDRDKTYKYQIKFRLPNDKPLVLKFNFTPNYPVDELPVFTLETRWLNDEQLEVLKTALVRIFKEDAQKQGTIANWVEWLKDNALQALNINPLESATVSDDEEEEEKLIVIHGNVANEKKNRFQAHLFEINTMEHCKAALAEIKALKKDATSLSWAYSLRLNNNTKEAKEDDKVKDSGSTVLELIHSAGIGNVLVGVVLWSQSDDISPDCVKHLTQHAKAVLTSYSKSLTERKENKAKNKPKKKFRPTADVLSRIRHDAAYSPEEFLIGYEDRFVGIKEINLKEFDVGDIPVHRIRYFKRNEDIVWDRRTKLDKVFF